MHQSTTCNSLLQQLYIFKPFFKNTYLNIYEDLKAYCLHWARMDVLSGTDRTENPKTTKKWTKILQNGKHPEEHQPLDN